MTSQTHRRSKPGSPAGQRPRNGRVGLVAALLVAAVVAAIIVSLVLAGTEEPAEDSQTADSAHIPTTGTLRQQSFAEVLGAPLPFLTGSADPAVGQPAPTITASYFDDSEVTVDFADGQPRIVLFLAHWCPHCQAEVSALVERFERLGVPDDVDILAISTSVDEGAPNYPPSQWLLAEQWPTPTLRDSADNALAAGFGLSSFPFMVVVGGDGTVMARRSGSIPEAEWNTLFDLAG